MEQLRRDCEKISLFHKRKVQEILGRPSQYYHHYRPGLNYEDLEAYEDLEINPDVIRSDDTTSDESGKNTPTTTTSTTDSIHSTTSEESSDSSSLTFRLIRPLPILKTVENALKDVDKETKKILKSTKNKDSLKFKTAFLLRKVFTILKKPLYYSFTMYGIFSYISVWISEATSFTIAQIIDTIFNPALNDSQIAENVIW